MISKEVLRQVVYAQKATPFDVEKTVRREQLPEVLAGFNDNRVLILTGIRRCGKSTLLRQIISEQKAPWCYVSFEDERFLDFKAQDFELLNEVLMEAYGTPTIYFFDEIQNVEHFEAFVRRLQDQGKKVVLTGSNAALLSGELGTRLTGRYKTFELYPFSFREFLAFKNVHMSKEDSYQTEEKVKLLKLFEQYLTQGGFPEYLKNQDNEYLRTIYENILYRDIIARYGIKRQRTLRELANTLATNPSSKITYNALKKTLGLANAMTVKEYLAHLANAYLFFELPQFDFSIKKQLNAPKKTYSIDTAFNRLMSINTSANKGRTLENVVFLELKRKGMEIYYHQTNHTECDFLTKQGTKIKQVIQVCQTLEPGNQKRELAGLLDALQKFNLKEGLLLTHEQEQELNIESKTIHVRPVWKWLAFPIK